LRFQSDGLSLVTQHEIKAVDVSGADPS